MTNGKKTILKFLSILFSAPLYALILHFFLTFFYSDYSHGLNPVIMFLFGLVFLTILPPLPIVISARKGDTDIFVSEREKRFKFFIWAILIYFIGAIILLQLGLKLASLFILCYATVTTSIAILNMFTKVSVHVAGITGPLTYIVLIIGFHLLPLYLLAVVVAWERLESKAHDLKQILIAVLDSIIVTFLTVEFFLLVLF